MDNILVKESTKTDEKLINDMYAEIANIISNNKEKMIYQINGTLVNTYFLIGKVIVENEQQGNIRAEYGKEILKKLSKKINRKIWFWFQ